MNLRNGSKVGKVLRGRTAAPVLGVMLLAACSSRTEEVARRADHSPSTLHGASAGADGGGQRGAQDDSPDADSQNKLSTSPDGGSPQDGGSPVAPDPFLSDCVPGIPGASQIPRLTNEQYDRTLRDLVGIAGLTVSSNQPPSSLLAPYHSGELTEQDWAGYMTAAKVIAAQVMADPDLRARFFACTPTGDGADCLRTTIVEFGGRAFRRPLVEAEIASFGRLVDQRADVTAHDTAEEVAEAILYTFLISPSFLQRAEITDTSDGTGNFLLSDFEVASRLSYLLWGSMPDEALSTAAGAGKLQTSAQILSQAQRMLGDPKAHDSVAAFHRAYLRMNQGSRWEAVTKDATRFPTFSQAVVPAMIEETERFFDYVVFDQRGSFQDLLLSPVGYVNASTAPMYGLNPADFGAALQRVTLDTTQRPGFLTRVGFLTAYSTAARSSPIDRGGFILRSVLGISIGPEKPSSPETPLPQGADLDTNRKRVEAQDAAPVCAACHVPYVDPPGFVLEAFNAVGSWQTNEADNGAPIDTVADVYIDGLSVTITDPADLMAKLAASRDAQRQYVQAWLDYANEQQISFDACTVDELSAKLTSEGYSVQDLLIDLTQTESFRVRALEVEP